MAKYFPTWRHCFLASLLLVACTQAHKSPPDTITTDISAPVNSLDPLYSTDGNNQHINQIVHAALVRTGTDLRPEPEIAESFTIKNPTTIAFTLRKNCKFQNGRALTAQDVRKSWQLFVDPKRASALKDSFSRIQDIQVIDDLHFVLLTKEPSPSLISDLALLKIIPFEEYEKPGYKALPVGAGPFRVTKYSPKEVVLDRVDGGTCYEPTPQYRRLVVKAVRDDLARLLKLRNGELDIDVSEMGSAKVVRAVRGEEPMLSAVVSEGISFSYLGVNVLDPALRDKRVRQALAYSFDIDSLTHYKGDDLQSQARNILADVNFYANTKLPFYKRDLEKARKLLDEAGYYNGRNNKPVLHLRLTSSNQSFAVGNARVLAAQAKEAGIEIDQRAFEWGTFLADVNAGNTQLYLLRWLGASDPSIYAENFSTTARRNRTRYSNPQMDALFAKGERTMDVSERKKIYLEVQELVHEELPYIHLWHNKNFATFRKNIKNVSFFPNGSWRMFLFMKKEGSL